MYLYIYNVFIFPTTETPGKSPALGSKIIPGMSQNHTFYNVFYRLGHLVYSLPNPRIPAQTSGQINDEINQGRMIYVFIFQPNI